MASITVKYPHPPGKSGGVMALHITVMLAVLLSNELLFVNVFIVEGNERNLR